MILIPKYSNILELSGSLSIIVTDENMKVKQELYVPNTIVTAGKNHIANRLGAASPAARMTFMAIGTGSTAVDPANTTLATEVSGAGYQRKEMSGTSGSNSIEVTNAQVLYSATFGANVPTTSVVIREAGIFNALTSGTMLCRTVFPIVTKEPLDTLTINWTITVSSPSS